MVEIVCGDCLEIMSDYLQQRRQFDFGFTSPPYNRKRNDKYMEYTDIKKDYLSFLCEFTEKMLKLCTKGFFVNMQQTSYNREEVFQYIGKYAKEIKQVLIWGKTNPTPASGCNVTNSFEYFLWFSANQLKSLNTYTKNLIITSVNSKMPKEHRAVMKQEVSDFFISNFVPKGSTVLDPFFGLGTTGISCEKFGSDCTGIEISSIYADEAKKRIGEFIK